MAFANFDVTLGDKLATPAGRVLEVADIFVPRHHRDKSRDLPAQFRNMNRKLVVFQNGTMTSMTDIRARYSRVS